MAKSSTRNKILSVADTLFSKFGFHRTSMDEIAKIARKAKGSLYYHFASKEDLFKEIVANEINNLKKQLSIIVHTDCSAEKKLENYLITRMEILNNASNYHETLKADFFEHFDFIDAIRVDFDEWEKNNLRKILLEGIETNEFTSIEDMNILLDVLLMILKGLEIPFYLQNKYERYSPHFENLMKILTKGLQR